jgi:hypothetical protein
VKPLLVLLAFVLLGIGTTACGGAGNATGSAPKVSSNVATTGSAPTTTASAGATPTGTTAAGGGESSRGTDNGISTYGHEASAADRRTITALVKRYYKAAAEDDGATACSLIYSILAEAVPEDYGQPPGPPALRGKTCAVVMSKLFKRIPGQPSSVLSATEVTGVRVAGRRGFAQLHSSAMPTGEIAVERELGRWKIGSLTGGACTKCSAGHRGRHE